MSDNLTVSHGPSTTQAFRTALKNRTHVSTHSSGLTTLAFRSSKVVPATDALTVSHGSTIASRSIQNLKTTGAQNNLHGTTSIVATSSSKAVQTTRAHRSSLVLITSASSEATKKPTRAHPSSAAAFTTKKFTTVKTQRRTTDRTTKKPQPPPKPVIRVFIITFVMPREDSNGVEDSNSAGYLSLQIRIIRFFIFLYSGFNSFVRVVIVRFSIFGGFVRTSGVEAEIRLEFNESAAVSEIPEDSVVEQVFVNGSSLADSFNISAINTTSIKVTEILIQELSNQNQTTNSTTTTATTTPEATTKALTVKPVVTAGITVIRRITFTSRTSTFVADLLNPESTAFKERALLIQSQLEPKFREQFPSLISLRVVSFSNGSVINNVDVEFPFASVPTNAEMADLLSSLTVVGFDIDIASILVDGATSCGASQAVSVISTLVLALLSMLLMRLQ